MSFCVFAVKSAVKSAVKLVTIVKDKWYAPTYVTYVGFCRSSIKPSLMTTP